MRYLSLGEGEPQMKISWGNFWRILWSLVSPLSFHRKEAWAILQIIFRENHGKISQLLKHEPCKLRYALCLNGTAILVLATSLIMTESLNGLETPRTKTAMVLVKTQILPHPKKNYIEIDPQDFTAVLGVPLPKDKTMDADELRSVASDYYHQRDLKERTPDIMPTDGIRQHDYGWRKRVYGGVGKDQYGFHAAEDIAAGLGTPVVAAAKGIITKVGYEPWPRGFYIEISHGKNAEGLDIRTRYLHLSAISEKITGCGVEVAKGETIGLVGAEGFATGPHLHYETSRGGVNVNPDEYLPSK